MPKLHAYKRFNYTADIYDYRLVTGPDGVSDPVYFLLRGVTLDVVQDEFGRLLCMFKDSEADLKPLVQLNNLKDKDGREIYPAGIWTLDTFEPNLNLMDKREGFRGRASLTHEDGAVG